MPKAKNKTAVILDAAPTQRDRLRSAVMALGFSALCFSRESSLLDNFRSLSPNLLLIGDIEERRMLRIFYTVKTNNAVFPVLFAQCSDTVLQMMESNSFANVACLNGDLTPDQLQTSLDSFKPIGEAPKSNASAPIVVGHSPEMQKIRKLIREIGASMAPILITGETGTGKDLMAQAIYHDGKLPDEKLVKIDVEAFLAGRDRPTSRWLPEKLGTLAPLSADASSGPRPPRRHTVMIDGIDHLPFEHQERFVEFLAGKNFDGAVIEDPFQKLRLICTSRNDIPTQVELGRFRKDLYHLLSVFALTLPPLRMRADDILLLADYFEGIYCLEFSRTAMDICDSAKEPMLSYSWPGNVSELKQAIIDALSAGENGFLHRHLQNAIKAQPEIDSKKPPPGFNLPFVPPMDHKNQTLSLKEACKSIVETTEKRIIAQALDRTNWNRRRAARILDVSYRTLLNKIKAYGLK